MTKVSREFVQSSNDFFGKLGRDLEEDLEYCGVRVSSKWWSFERDRRYTVGFERVYVSMNLGSASVPSFGGFQRLKSLEGTMSLADLAGIDLLTSFKGVRVLEVWC